MKESSWTLAGELKELSGEGDLSRWFHQVGLIGQGDDLRELEIVRGWYRSGAETYGLRFAVISHSGNRQECFMKACVAYGGGMPLPDIFSSWLARRAVVAESGIATPRIYAAGAAIIVEEYIPYTLSDALRHGRQRSSIVSSIGSTAACLINVGFIPVSSHDWRSRGGDVVLVDFGQDLGPPDMLRGSESGLLSEVLDNLLSDGVKLSDDELRLIGSAYERVLHS